MSNVKHISEVIFEAMRPPTLPRVIADLERQTAHLRRAMTFDDPEPIARTVLNNLEASVADLRFLLGDVGAASSA